MSRRSGKNPTLSELPMFHRLRVSVRVRQYTKALLGPKKPNRVTADPGVSTVVNASSSPGDTHHHHQQTTKPIRG